MKFQNAIIKNAQIKSLGNVTDGLVLNLDAATYTSGDWVDSISGIHYTLYNNPTYSADNGGILTFDPASQQFAEGPPLNSSLTNWTVEAWLKHDATNMPPGGSPCIVTQVYAGTPINFTVGNTNDDFPNLKTGFFNGGWIATNNGVTLTTGNWYHIIGSWDGTNIRLHLNSILMSSGSSPGSVSSSGNQDIRLMRRWDADQYWGGSLGQVKIYNRALSDVEIYRTFNDSRARYGI